MSSDEKVSLPNDLPSPTTGRNTAMDRIRAGPVVALEGNRYRSTSPPMATALGIPADSFRVWDSAHARSVINIGLIPRPTQGCEQAGPARLRRMRTSDARHWVLQSLQHLQSGRLDIQELRLSSSMLPCGQGLRSSYRRSISTTLER